jgi:hypothetical protein
MKKLHYLLASIAVLLVTITACENPSVDAEELQTIQKEELSSKPNKAQEKMDICHWTGKKWVSISVAESSLDAHWAHGDKYAYSPEGTYTIYRDNAADGGHPTPAILNITVLSDGTITGEGVTAANLAVYYEGTVTVYPDHSILMIIPQYDKNNDNYRGTHYIGGFVSECGGIIEDLSDESGNDKDYSFTEF